MFKPKQELIVNELIHLFGSFPQRILNTTLIHISNVIHLLIQVLGCVRGNVFDHGLFSFLPIALGVGTTEGQRVWVGHLWHEGLELVVGWRVVWLDVHGFVA
jgi:hypothetical protein